MTPDRVQDGRQLMNGELREAFTDFLWEIRDAYSDSARRMVLMFGMEPLAPQPAQRTGEETV